VTPRAVKKAVESGRIKLTADGRIDPIQADKDWDANTAPDSRSTTRKKSTAKKDNKVVYAKERANREWALARLARLELKEKSGKLIDREKVTSAYSKMVSAARNRLLGIKAKLAPAVAIETDPVVCELLIETEIMQALEELGQYQPSTPPEPTARAA